MIENDLWYNSVCLEENEDYVIKILNKFSIENYNIINIQGDLCLVFTYQLKNYRCEINKDNMEIILLEKNLIGNKKGKEFCHFVAKFHNGGDEWYELFKWIKRRKSL